MEFWELDEHGRVAVLTFTRPPANWMSLAAMTELVDALEYVARRSRDVSVVMLTGGLPGYFIAHADLDDLAMISRGQTPPGDPSAWNRALHLLETIPQPTVAAIDGQAWGGGCETALACTMRIGSPAAHLGQPEVAVGIIPGAGGTQRLPRIVGPAIGAELVLTGRIVNAREAVQIGLLNAVLDTDDFRTAAIEWCAQIAVHSPTAVFAAKRAVTEGLALPLADGLALETRLFLEVNASDDARSRNAAISRPDEKRIPAPIADVADETEPETETETEAAPSADPATGPEPTTATADDDA